MNDIVTLKFTFTSVGMLQFFTDDIDVFINNFIFICIRFAAFRHSIVSAMKNNKSYKIPFSILS